VKTESETVRQSIIMSAGGRSSQLLALVVIFFSSYIVGIYSAARASSLALAPLSKANESLILGNDTLLAEDGNSSLVHSGSRHPRCKFKLLPSRLLLTRSGRLNAGSLFFRRGGSMWVRPQLSPTVHVPQVDSLVLAVPMPYNHHCFRGKRFHLRIAFLKYKVEHR